MTVAEQVFANMVEELLWMGEIESLNNEAEQEKEDPYFES